MFGETQIFFLGGNQPMQVEKPGKIPRGGGGGGGGVCPAPPGMENPGEGVHRG